MPDIRMMLARVPAGKIFEPCTGTGIEGRPYFI